MSKTSKQSAEDIMKKRLNKRKEEMVTAAKKDLDQKLTNICYTVVTDPDKGGRNFLLVKLKFDIKTMKALVEDYVNLDQKVIGMKHPLEQENLKYYYNQAKKAGEKNE